VQPIATIKLPSTPGLGIWQDDKQLLFVATKNGHVISIKARVSSL